MQPALNILSWPASFCVSSPVDEFHSRTDRSSDADATTCPSGEKATAVTLFVCPSSLRILLRLLRETRKHYVVPTIL